MSTIEIGESHCRLVLYTWKQYPSVKMHLEINSDVPTTCLKIIFTLWHINQGGQKRDHKILLIMERKSCNQEEIKKCDFNGMNDV